MCFSKTRLKIQLDFGPWFVRSSGESRLAVSSACCPASWHCLGAVHLRPRGFWKRILRQETENQAAKVDLWQRHVWMTWAVNRLIIKCMCIFFPFLLSKETSVLPIQVCLFDQKVPLSPRRKVNPPQCTPLYPQVTRPRTAGKRRYTSVSLLKDSAQHSQGAAITAAVISQYIISAGSVTSVSKSWSWWVTDLLQVTLQIVTLFYTSSNLIFLLLGRVKHAAHVSTKDGIYGNMRSTPLPHSSD